MSKTTKLTAALATGALALLVLIAWPGASGSEHAEILPVREPALDELGQMECPGGGETNEMARMPEGFCIDTTEVTRGAYATWLEGSPDTAGQPSACSENDDFEPSCAWPPGGNADQPVVCVDWCDARAYCEAAGKRLCGGIGDGGGYAFLSFDDPTVSEWHAACTSGGAYEYPYGDTLDTQTCRGADAEDHTTWGFVDVGTLAGCHSPDDPYSEVFDLSGNAAEWDNACDGDAPESPCRIRGGSFEFNERGLRCSMASGLRWPRMRRVVSVGFRCCAD